MSNLPVITRKATVARPGVIVSTITDNDGAETVTLWTEPTATGREIHISRRRTSVNEAPARHADLVAALR